MTQPYRTKTEWETAFKAGVYCPCGTGECEAMRERFKVAGKEVGGNYRPCKAPRFTTAEIYVERV